MKGIYGASYRIDDFENETTYAICLIEDRMNNTIIARNNEIESIKKQFDLVLEGGSGVAVITGLPGIGKTFLVEQVVKELASSNVTYVYGKFRQHHKKPFCAISEIIEQIVKHLFTLPSEQLQKIKRTLKKALGSDISIITSINPYAQMLLGHRNTIGMDTYETLKYRVRSAVYKFFAIASEPLFPLIMFIDDLQWADTPSLELMQLICKDNELLNLLLILAYRDNAPTMPQINNECIRMQLQELTDADIKEYIHFVFGAYTKNLDYLARIAYGLTLGNPFYIKEIMSVFIREHILVYSAEKRQWVVEISRINNLTLPNDIKQIITNKIDKLSSEDKSLLELIACLDGKVEHRLLEKIVTTDDASLNNRLQRLCKAAFLMKTVEEYQSEETLSYSFVHDIVLERIYEHIDPQKKARTHYNIAKQLTDDVDKKFAENNRLFIASHLLRSDYNVLTQDNTEQWVYELYYAGMEAKQNTAFEQALELLESSVGLLSYCNLKEKHDLEMKLNLELGECEFTCQKYEEAKKRFEALLAKYNTAENLVTIKRSYMNLYAHSGNSEKVLELGIEVLNHLNFKFSTRDLRLDLIKGKLLFSNRKIAELKDAPVIKDKRLVIILETLTQMLPASNIINDKVFDLILLKIGILSAKYGNSPYSPIGYVAYNHILYTIWKDHKKGKRLENITLELLEAIDNPSTKSIVYAFIGTFIDHWSNPMEKSIEYLEYSIEEGVRVGEFIYSGYAIVSIIYAKYIMGIPLNEITDYSNFLVRKLQRVGCDTVSFIDQLFNRHINYLEKGVLTKEDHQIHDEIKLLGDNRNLTYYAFMLQRLYLEGELEKAYEIVEDITPNISFLIGHIVYMDLLFYCVLTRLSKHQNLEATKKRENKGLIEKYMKELTYWTNICKENHYGRYLLAKAEYTKLFQKEKHSERLYHEAISFAGTNRYLQIGAIGSLLAAEYYAYNTKLSQFYARESVSLFEKWGAMYIASVIEQRFGLRDTTKLLSEEEQLKEIDGEIDKSILYHLDQMENMEEEQGFIYMLDFLTKSNHADYGAVLFEKSDEMYLQYEKKKTEKVIVHKEPINLQHVDNLSRKIIRYVARTGEEVVLNRKPNEGIFANDLYKMNQNEVSIVCIPIKYLGVFAGIIYLERMCRNGFSESIAPTIRSVIPSLISKRLATKNRNLHSGLDPKEVDESFLTDRELEVLMLVAEGMSNSAISKQLYISLGTVKNHLSNIYSKLEVDSRIKAVVKAKELNIITI